MSATFGYWSARGIANHIRLLMEYTGEEYNDKLYKIGSDEWSDDKFKLGLDYPNLPYYIDGDIKITQSSAIFSHIARTHKMIANETKEDAAKSDMLEYEAMDLRMKFERICYNPEFDNLKDNFISDTVTVKLGQYSKILGDNKWFFGDKITYVDFLFYETLCAIMELSQSTFNKWINLKAFLTRFESLEPVKKYMNSTRYFKGPFNGPTAYFGTK